MQHKIGNNYKEIIKSRKNKNDYPHVGKLKMTIDLSRLQDEVTKLLSLQTSDSLTTEIQYRLNNSRGEKFIKDYEEFIKHYSSVTFHKITDEGEAIAKSITKSLDDYSPLDRLKGMVDTGSRFYHPYFDERNYTEFTESATGYIREILESFDAVTCRAAIVVLKPGQRITRHFDVGPEHIIRLHIPLFTNTGATMGFKSVGGWDQYHLPADGGIYAVNTGIEHWAQNTGTETRYQMRICLTSQEDTVDMQTVNPVSFITDEEFIGHLCS